MASELSPKAYQAIYEWQVKSTKLLAEHEAAYAARKLKAKRGPSAGGGVASPTGNPMLGLAEDTQFNYRRRGKQLLNDARQAGRNVWEMTKSNTPAKGGAWYVAKASTQMVVFENLRHAKREIDVLVPLLRAGQLSGERMHLLAHHIGELQFYVSALETMPSSKANAIALVAAFSGNTTPSSSLTTIGGPAAPGSNNKVTRVSKSASLRYLPRNWREMVAGELPPSTALLWLIQAVTGCRPKELGMGMTVVLSHDRKQITFKVVGAKVTEHAGQPLRTITYATNTALTQLLSTKLTPSKEEVVALDRSRDAYRHAIKRVCKKLWPRRSAATMPSVYSARHQAKSDMKALGMSQEKIAQTLGHSGTASQSYYGGSGKASGAVAPTSVQATRKIKIKVGYVAKAATSKKAAKKSGSTTTAGAPTAARRANKP